jgi:hypothetical protein
MYANVTLGTDLRTRVQVPSAAVVYTGPRRLVFVDQGQGRFRPQEVSVGIASNGMYEVLSGLKVGDQVATSGVFLIAAEARISTASKYWDSSESASASNASARPMIPPAPMPGPSLAPSGANSVHSSSKPPGPATTVYSCPMHPEVQSSSPGKCPKCGMNLEPRPRPKGGTP